MTRHTTQKSCKEWEDSGNSLKNSQRIVNPLCWRARGTGIEKQSLSSGERVKSYSRVIKEKTYPVEFLRHAVKKMREGTCKIQYGYTHSEGDQRQEERIISRQRRHVNWNKEYQSKQVAPDIYGFIWRSKQTSKTFPKRKPRTSISGNDERHSKYFRNLAVFQSIRCFVSHFEMMFITWTDNFVFVFAWRKINSASVKFLL